MTFPKYFVVIVAAGSGSRYGGDLPKQFLSLVGKPVVCHSIDAFRSTIADAQIYLILSKEGKIFWDKYCDESGYISPTIVIGGDSRQESVYNALEAIAPNANDNDKVFIHDGARPLVASSLISELADKSLKTGNVIPVHTMTDTIVQVRNNEKLYINRQELFGIETPQVFCFRSLFQVHNMYKQTSKGDFTDDSSMMVNNGYEVELHINATPNIKITTPGDLELAEFFLSRNKE